MAQQTINVGAAPNDGTGTPLRTAFQYTNSNFTELYTAVGPSGNNIVVPGSATITGDLTVDTSTLKVDSANNRVGIVQATPLYPLDVTGTVNGTAVAARLGYGVGGSVYSAFRFENTSFSGGNSEIRNYVNGATGTGSDLAFFTTQTGGSTLTERYRLDVSGVATWSNVGGVAGTAMTLNSTGLGVGGSPTSKLHVSNTGAATRITITDDTTNGRSGYIESNFSDALVIGTTSGVRAIRFSPDNKLYYQIATDGVQTWLDGIGGTRMTLNSTGLGIGVTPSGGNRLMIQNTTDCTVVFKSSAANVNSAIDYVSNYGNYTIRKSGTAVWDYGVINDSSATPAFKFSNGTDRLVIDSSGNVGIGVTPSAWNSSAKAFEIGTTGNSVFSSAATFVEMTNNAYLDSVSNWNRVNTGNAAARFRTSGSGFLWLQAAAGANPITWTQPMTLDASGNLLVGKSVSLFSTVGVEASGTGFISATNSASTNASTNLSVYSTGAAAFRFYVGLGGTVFATNTTISAISDARLKENVQDLDVGLGAILALKPRKFDWKAGKGKDIKGDRGFIAQEFEQVFPQLVDEWKDEAPEGEAPYKSVRQDLIPVLVKAIQELAAEVNALKNA